jgi:hypothetical protein
METETQKIGTGTGTRNPLRDRKMRGGEAMIDIHREEKKDQRASGLGTTEIPVAVTKEGVMKRQNDMENRGDKTRLCQAHAALLIWLMLCTCTWQTILFSPSMFCAKMCRLHLLVLLLAKFMNIL